MNKMDIVEYLIPREEGLILDVGCGDIDVTGHLYCNNRLIHKYKGVIGIDINPGRRENVIRASATNIPFADQSIDYLVSCDVIEHIKDYSSVIKDMLRVARERVIIIVPTTKSRFIRPFLNFLRRMLRGVDNFVFQGHFYEFYPSEICSLKGNQFSCKLITINYPILGSSLLHRKGWIIAGIYVFDRVKQ